MFALDDLRWGPCPERTASTDTPPRSPRVSGWGPCRTPPRARRGRPPEYSTRLPLLALGCSPSLRPGGRDPFPDRFPLRSSPRAPFPLRPCRLRPPSDCLTLSCSQHATRSLLPGRLCPSPDRRPLLRGVGTPLSSGLGRLRGRCGLLRSRLHRGRPLTKNIRRLLQGLDVALELGNLGLPGLDGL